MQNFTTNIVDIDCNSGYTLEQIMNSKNCSKDKSFWWLIKKTAGTDKELYLFRSNCAESWEFWDPQIVNPIRNSNLIYLRFLDVNKFIEPSNYFREHKIYTKDVQNTVKWNRYLDDL